MSDIGNPLWYEKYRPKTWEDYVWIDSEFKEKIERYLKEPSETPHMCLVGFPGVGKTTLALLLAHSMVNEESDVLFVEASTDSGVQMIRDSVNPFCQNAGWSEIRFVILDEAERLNEDVQKMLRNTINTYGDFVRFIFTCNSSTRIKDFMDSRVRTIQFDALDREQFLERILTILTLEEVELDEPALVIVQKIIERHYPDMRKTIDMLQDCCIAGKLVESQRATRVDRPWLEAIIGHLRTGLNISQLREQLAELQPDQILSVYPSLVEAGSELFGDDEGLAIVAIRDYMIAHTHASFPALNLLGLIIHLNLLQHSKDKS